MKFLRKRLILTPLGLLFCTIFAFDLWAYDAVLLDDLKAMYDKDQTARFEIINSRTLLSNKGVEMIEKIDQENLPRLKAIISQFGWPGFQLVGEGGADKMWLLVQHCDQDVEFQKLCLQLLKESVSKGDAPKRHLAYLTDRVLVNEGHSQIYGTQIQIENGKPIPSPIEEAHNLDIRRAEMELEPFAEYLSLFKKVYLLED